MYSAISGQLGIAKQMEIIANNLANMTTTGYRAERPLFEKALSASQTLATNFLKKDIQNPGTLRAAEFSHIRGSFSDSSQGPIESTGRNLDAAIEGKGFFVIQTPDGERYTRAGNFRLDSTGKLVTQSGLNVSGAGGDITLPPGAEVTIAQDGSLLSDGKVVAKMKVVDVDASQLDREANQLFKLRDGASASDLTDPHVHGGALENSNVNAVRELADMILASRLFEGFKSAQEAGSRMSQASTDHVGTTQA